MQKPGDPYIQKPDGHTEEEDTLYCWNDLARVCNGSCVAFDPYLKPTPCLLINAGVTQAGALKQLFRSTKPMPGTDIPSPGVR
jgi:hypothetical protein